MRALIAFAALAAAAAHADSLEIYRSIDAQGRVSFTNIKPKHSDYDVVNVEYQAQPRAATAVAPVAIPRAANAEGAASRSALAPGEPAVASFRVIAFPSLRLAAATGEPATAHRRKAHAVPVLALRMDRALRSFAD